MFPAIPQQPSLLLFVLLQYIPEMLLDLFHCVVFGARFVRLFNAFDSMYKQIQLLEFYGLMP